MRSFFTRKSRWNFSGDNVTHTSRRRDQSVTPEERSSPPTATRSNGVLCKGNGYTWGFRHVASHPANICLDTATTIKNKILVEHFPLLLFRILYSTRTERHIHIHRPENKKGKQGVGRHCTGLILFRGPPRAGSADGGSSVETAHPRAARLQKGMGDGGSEHI